MCVENEWPLTEETINLIKKPRSFDNMETLSYFGVLEASQGDFCIKTITIPKTYFPKQKSKIIKCKK